MTPEEIIAMAREAGIHIDRLPDEYCAAVNLPLGSVSRWDGVGLGELQSFATLVAAKEREACAQVCESWDDPRDYAAAIRARGQKEELV